MIVFCFLFLFLFFFFFEGNDSFLLKGLAGKFGN